MRSATMTTAGLLCLGAKTALGILRGRCLPVLRFAIPFVLAPSLASPCQAQAVDEAVPSAAEAWMADIQSLNRLLREHHPDPFFQTGEGRWRDGLQEARDLVLAGGSDVEITTTLMSAVAGLRDGHTRLEPVGIDGFAVWLPLRFYEFDDGVYVTVAAEQHAELIGRRLVRVEQLPVEEVLAKVTLATAGDNALQVKEGAAALLSNVGLLSALGVTDPSTDAVSLAFEHGDGTTETRRLPRIHSEYSANYRNWGELFGPPFEPFDNYRTPFDGGKPPLAYRDPPAAEDAPFYASRKPFWARLDQAQTVLTFQFNFFADIGDIGWDDFRARMWDMVDRAQPERFVIDLRYNFGGDGRMVTAFVNELLARPRYANDNRLVVLTGRQTFSAAVMLVAELIDHTDAVFVGEPPGAPLNSYGDPISLRLPSGRLELVVSTLYWQLGHPADRAKILPIHLCVQPRASDYFAGRDVAWDLAAREDLVEIRAQEKLCEDGGSASPMGS